MVLLSIRISDLKDHLAESKISRERHPTYSQKLQGFSNAPVGIWLVKDTGCYIMSNSKDRKLEVSYVFADQGGKFGLVDGSNWELQQSIEGSDFTEFLSEAFVNDMIKYQSNGFAYIEFDEEGISIIHTIIHTAPMENIWKVTQ
jgi:hypothetical protein